MSHEVEIIANGPVGSGKSALLGEIEILLRALNIPYRWADPEDAQSEKNLTHADWIGELEATKPTVVLVEHHKRSGDTAHKKAYEEGLLAYPSGKQVVDNPYLSGQDSLNWPCAYQWLVGFMQGMVNHLAKPHEGLA